MVRYTAQDIASDRCCIAIEGREAMFQGQWLAAAREVPMFESHNPRVQAMQIPEPMTQYPHFIFVRYRDFG